MINVEPKTIDWRNTIVDETDPDFDDDQDRPTPPDVAAVLGFDPDDEVKAKA